MAEQSKSPDMRLTAYPQTSSDKERELEAVLRQDPTNVHAKKTLAFTYYTNQKFQAAIELYFQLATQDPADPAVHFYTGNTLYRLRSYGAAVAAWEKAIACDSTGIYRERAEQRIAMARQTPAH